ncbi:MAG: response regulator [Deltaproteobacteria bacterium]
MNRRVLLIDADPAFRDTLTRELARYKVVVTTEPDAERALALAGAGAPALILLTIEEADKKSGFRVFEKCKKGALSKTPIILVTGSVPPESFAKHRNLKVHADEYIDKRSMSTHELVGKIDGLIALGDPEEDELAIPVEDEIPMEIAEGDVVLDEVVGDDQGDQPALLAHEPPVLEEPDAHDEFETNEGRTVSSDGLTVDSVVEAETDAAFDALMGGGFGDPEPEPSAEMIAEQGEHREQSATIPPVQPESNPVDEALAGAEEAVSVPELIHDGRGRGTTPPPLIDSVPAIILDSPHHVDEMYAPRLDEGAVPEPVPDQEPHLPPVVADSLPESIDVAALSDAADADAAHAALDDLHPEEHAVAQVHEEIAEDGERAETTMAGATDMYAAHDDVDEDDPRMESQPAILIDDDELVPLDDELPVEVEEPGHEPSTTQQIPHAPVVADAAPRGRAGSTTSSPVDLSQPARGGSGSHPAIDLGLDVVAEDARSEQSGVYDRRALRKIGELERQIAQLKTELERARAAGETAAKGGRESQFLHLRESILAKDKELKQYKNDLATRESELAEATELVKQAQAAKAALDAKHGELERRAAEDAAKAQKLGAAHRASEGQASQLQQALERAEKATAAADAARAQLEQDLATERATGKASASESERLLRTEREQLVQRHQQELAAAAAAADEAQISALAALRDELENTHDSELEQQIEALRRAHAQEHEAALAALEKQHSSITVALKAEHAGEQSRVKSDLGGQISQLRAALAEAKAAHEDAITAAMGTHASLLEQQADAHAAVLARQANEQRVAIEERERAHATALADKDRTHHALVTEATQAAASAAAERERLVAAAGAERDRAVADAIADRDGATDKLRREHAAALAERDQAFEQLQREHTAQLAEQDRALAQRLADQKRAHDDALAARMREAEDQAIAQAATLSDVRTELERARASHAAELERTRADHAREVDEAHRAAEAAAAQHEASRGELHEQHRAMIAELEAKHEQAVAQLSEAARRAADSHRAGLADAVSAHAAELQQVAESAGREVAEHKAAAAAARRAAEDAAARHAAEREEAAKAHAQQLADTEAKVERQLAIANGEFLKQKSVSDAEHARTVAALQADAEKTRTELLSEHGRVARDLTAERDELKKGLSSARDSLKRSEGELASAVQSIADRNAELRQHASAIAERDTRIAELRKEIETLEAENTSYQEQVLRAYQKIKTDEAMVARARKAMAIALTVLDDQGNPKET